MNGAAADASCTAFSASGRRAGLNAPTLLNRSACVSAVIVGAERAVAAIGGRHHDNELVLARHGSESGPGHEGGVVLAAAVEQVDDGIAVLRSVVGLRQQDREDALSAG